MRVAVSNQNALFDENLVRESHSRLRSIGKKMHIKRTKTFLSDLLICIFPIEIVGISFDPPSHLAHIADAEE